MLHVGITLYKIMNLIFWGNEPNDKL
jgi:hypothetical protein